jgi:hypothetical protein
LVALLVGLERAGRSNRAIYSAVFRDVFSREPCPEAKVPAAARPKNSGGRIAPAAIAPSYRGAGLQRQRFPPGRERRNPAEIGRQGAEQVEFPPSLPLMGVGALGAPSDQGEA